MPATVRPTPQQLLQYPARYIHTTSVPVAAKIAEKVNYFMASDDATKQELARILLQSASNDVLHRTMASARDNINKQLAALQWNRLPDNVLSHVFSYLTTQHTIQLRHTCSIWNKVGQRAASFNTSTERGSILLVNRPGKYNLAGVRVVAVRLRKEVVELWGRDRGMAQSQFEDIVRSIVSTPSPCVERMVSRWEPYRVEPKYNGYYSPPCDLRNLWKGLWYYPLRSLELESNLWKVEGLEEEQPIESLTEFRGWMDSEYAAPPYTHGRSEHISLNTLARLMPNLQHLHLSYNYSGAVFTLQPILQLPSLTHLTIDTNNQACTSLHTPTYHASHLLPSSPPKCKLRYLQLICSERTHELLVASESAGLKDICADSIEHLVLYNMEHRAHFAAHLASFRQVQSLELLSPARQVNAADDHRQLLLAALKQLPQLDTLKLHVTSKGHQHNPVDRATAQPWAAEHLTALLRLPLQHLAVQHLESSAGQALRVLAAPEQHTIRTLQLGMTELDWSTVLDVADRLDRLLLPALAKPRPAPKQRKKRKLTSPSTKDIPPSVTFYKQWNEN